MLNPAKEECSFSPLRPAPGTQPLCIGTASQCVHTNRLVSKHRKLCVTSTLGQSKRQGFAGLGKGKGMGRGLRLPPPERGISAAKQPNHISCQGAEAFWQVGDGSQELTRLSAVYS